MSDHSQNPHTLSLNIHVQQLSSYRKFHLQGHDLFSFQTMEVLQHFNIFTHEDRHWIWLDQLLEFLKQDPSEANRPSKVLRLLNGYKSVDKISIINGQKALPLISLLKYVFHRKDNSAPCERIALSLEKLVVTAQNSEKQEPVNASKKDKLQDDIPPIFDLYKEIAHSDMGSSHAIVEHSSLHEVDDKDIPFLLHIHEDHFQLEEWNKIKIFETHFSHKYTNSQAPIDHINKAKWKMWKSYCEAKAIVVPMVEEAKEVI